MLFTVADDALPNSVPPNKDFRAAIAFYPNCAPLVAAKPNWKPRQRMLFLVGEADNFTLPVPCKEMLAREKAAGGPTIDVHFYPDTYHAFDHPNLPKTELTKVKNLMTPDQVHWVKPTKSTPPAKSHSTAHSAETPNASSERSPNRPQSRSRLGSIHRAASHHSSDLRKDRGAISAWTVRGGGRIPPSIRWWQTKASWQAPVKADSRRRRGPKARLYRACHEAILGPPGRRRGARRWVADFRFPSTL